MLQVVAPSFHSVNAPPPTDPPSPCSVEEGEMLKGKYDFLTVSTFPGLDSLKHKGICYKCCKFDSLSYPEPQPGVRRKELIFSEPHFVKHFTYLISLNCHNNP